MTRTIQRVLFALALAASAQAALAAQRPAPATPQPDDSPVVMEPGQDPPDAPAPAAARPGRRPPPAQPAVDVTPHAPSEQYVNVTGFKSKVFDVKHRNPDSLVPVLYPLGSGFKGAMIQSNREFKTLTVRDFPENIAAIGETLPRLDVPQAAQSDIELHLHVLVASPNVAPAGELPREIGAAVEQLRSTLNYKSFSLLASVIQRAQEGRSMTTGQGVAEVDLPRGGTQRLVDLQYRYGIRSIALAPDGSGGQRVDVDGFDFRLYGDHNEAGVASNLSIRVGEQVVVGTASFKNRGLVLILSAKVLK